MPKRILLGAIIGGLFCAIDGAIVGVIAKLFFDPGEAWHVIGMWTFYFALVGSILGGTLGALWKAIVRRIRLLPPVEEQPPPQ